MRKIADILKKEEKACKHILVDDGFEKYCKKCGLVVSEKKYINRTIRNITKLVKIR